MLKIMKAIQKQILDCYNSESASVQRLWHGKIGTSQNNLKLKEPYFFCWLNQYTSRWHIKSLILQKVTILKLYSLNTFQSFNVDKLVICLRTTSHYISSMLQQTSYTLITVRARESISVIVSHQVCLRMLKTQFVTCMHQIFRAVAMHSQSWV